MDTKISAIKNYLKIMNKNIDIIEKDNPSLVDFVISEVIDRVELYLNSEIIPLKLDRILAGIVNNVLKKYLKSVEIAKNDDTEIDQSISGISDNGQSISYANELTNYFGAVSDNELFSGFSSLLCRYRRIKVVHPKKNV